MVSQDSDRMHSDSTTRGGIANGIDDVNDMGPRDVALPTPGVPSDVRIQANGLVQSSFSHRTNQGLLTPRC